jgi:hypothetical protein
MKLSTTVGPRLAFALPALDDGFVGASADFRFSPFRHGIWLRGLGAFRLALRARIRSRVETEAILAIGPGGGHSHCCLGSINNAFPTYQFRKAYRDIALAFGNLHLSACPGCDYKSTALYECGVRWPNGISRNSSA